MVMLMMMMLDVGVALEYMGRYTDALDQFNKALAVRSDHLIALCNKGKH